MPLYCYAGQTIECQILLDELKLVTSTSSTDSDFKFRLLKAPPPELPDLKWSHQGESETSEPYQYMARTKNKIFLRFSSHADFVISHDGGQLDIWALPGTTEETIRHLLLDQVLPRVLDSQGQLVVHAGAVRVGNRAIAFIGETGAGKSTLTANFHINGFPLLSDDGLLINTSNSGTTALPTYPSLRLWPDTISSIYTENPPVAPVAHYSDKLRVIMEDTEEAMEDHLHLAAIYLLAPVEKPDQEAIITTRLRPIEACMTIISNSFQLDASNKVRTAERLNEAAMVSQTVPTFRLEYAREYSNLSDLRTTILKHLENCSAGF